MPLEEHNAQLRAVIEQNQRTLERMQQLLAALEKSIASNPAKDHGTDSKVILIVDDNPHDARRLERSVQRCRLLTRLQIVSTGAEAIAYIRGDDQYQDRARFPEPLLLFLDLKMPSVDGLDVLDFLKEHPKFAKFPVVVMSALGESKHVNRAYHLGARSFLAKPIDPEEVKATLEKLHIPVLA
ncbi:MAG: response regulator [Limisphaerales bacterium]